MDLDTLFLVFIFITSIRYSQQLQARKCHYRNPLSSSTEHCEDDLRRPRCGKGVISIQWVKHESDNCNVGCTPTCCTSINDYASDKVRQEVNLECNYKESCNLASITRGTAFVEYTCEDTTTSTISSPSFSSSIVATAALMTTHDSSTWMTRTSSNSYTAAESSIEVSGTTSSSFNSSAHDQNHLSLDKEDDLQTGTVVAVVVVVVVCVVSIPVTIILCRRCKNHRQQRNSDKLELDAATDVSNPHTQDVNRGPANSPTDNVPARYSHQVTEAGNIYNTTAEGQDRAQAASADNEYDHLDHRIGKLTGSHALKEASAENVYDTTLDTGKHANVRKSASNTDDVYDTADHSGRALLDDNSENNIENVYDTTHNDGNKHMFADNYNAYDTT